MRFFGVILMATGILGGGALAGTAVGNAPKPNAMQSKAPSTNPLDAVMNDIYRQQASGKISMQQAVDIYNSEVDKWMAKDPNVVKEHNRNTGQ